MQERDLQRGVLYFQLLKNIQDVFFVKCVIHTQQYCDRNTIFFSRENTQKTRVKNTKLDVFNQKLQIT